MWFMYRNMFVMLTQQMFNMFLYTYNENPSITRNLHCSSVYSSHNRNCIRTGGGLEQLWVSEVSIWVRSESGTVLSAVVFGGLTNDLPSLLDVSLSLRQNGWIQLDGLGFQYIGWPIHCARRVKNWFNRQYSKRWIGRRGPISWLSRSLDLTLLLDFYLWNTLKEKVTRGKLISKIYIACEEIRQNRNQMISTISSITCRCQIYATKTGVTLKWRYMYIDRYI